MPVELSQIPSLIKLIYSVSNLAIPRRSRQHVVRDLRFLRFDDDGILPLIDAVIVNRKSTIQLLMDRLENFAAYDRQVSDCVERLLDDCAEISRLTQSELRLIGNQKSGIRKDIAEELYSLGQPKARINRMKLLNIRSEIYALNLAIDQAEHLLQHGR